MATEWFCCPKTSRLALSYYEKEAFITQSRDERELNVRVLYVGGVYQILGDSCYVWFVANHDINDINCHEMIGL